jgi:membrane protein YqaA with SNARE-associated domain
VFVMAAMDGAGVPLPGAVDAVVVTFVFQKPFASWLYVLLAAGGSTLGCLVLYLVGYLGGEVLIERRMSREKFEKVRGDFENHPILTLALPAVLPPPFPFKVFVLSAGAFEMRWLEFVGVIFVARIVRFGILSLLTILFGPQIVTVFTGVFRRHPLVSLLIIAAAIAGVWVIRKVRRRAVAHSAA